MANNLDSMVTKRLKEEEPAFPFFSWFVQIEIYVCGGDLRCFVAGQICRKFTHFPSVKFPGLKMCECKKNDKYQVWCGDLFPCVPPGAMGVVMGHELSHAFDDQGRQYDAEGNMVNTTKDF